MSVQDEWEATKVQLRGCAAVLGAIVSFIGIVVFGLASLAFPPIIVLFMVCVVTFTRCWMIIAADTNPKL